MVDQPNIRFGGTLGIRKAMQRLHRSPPAVRSRGGRRHRPGLAVHAVHRRSRATEESRSKAWSAASGRPRCYRPQHRPRRGAGHPAQACPARSKRSSLASAAIAGRPMQRPGARRLHLRDASTRPARWRATSTVDGRDTIDTLRALLIRAESDRRAEDADPGVRRLRRWTTSSRRSLELGALAAAARTSIYALKLDDQLLQMCGVGAARADHADARPLRARRGSGNCSSARRAARCST